MRPTILSLHWRILIMTMYKDCNSVVLYVPPSLYRAQKLNFHLDFGGISPDGIIRTEICLSPTGKAVGILNQAMFYARKQS